MKQRPIDKLDLPAPPKPTNTLESRATRTDDGEAKLIADVGKRLEPMGFKYVGGVAAHIYAHPLKPEFQIITHTAGIAQVPETVALQASKEIGRKLMVAYGHKPPVKRGEVKEVLTP